MKILRDAIKKYWPQVKYQLMRVLRVIGDGNLSFAVFLVNLSLLLMLFISVALVFLAMAQVMYQGDTVPFSFARHMSDFIFNLFPDSTGVTKLASKDKAAVLGAVISAAGASVTAVFSLIAWVFSWVEGKSRAKKATISSQRVYDTSGLDDMRVMYKAYLHANQVYVIGGDFSWLNSSSPSLRAVEFVNMHVLVKKLACDGKIKIFSYKDEKAVMAAIGDEMFDKLKDSISYNPKLKDIKASIVESPFGRSLLYKVHSDLDIMHIFQISDRTADGKMLLNQFMGLVYTL